MHTWQLVEKGKPVNEAEKAIILLHGRGADGNNIITLATDLCDDSFYIVAPEATNNTWYPYSFMVAEERNEPWLTSAVLLIKRLIDQTSEHIPREMIYLLGFSQGACLALEVAARHPSKYAGIIAFTGGLIGEKINKDKYHGDFEGTKVFIGNSDFDAHIPLIRSRESKEILESEGADVTLKVYPNMPHTIIRDEIETVQKLMF